MITIGSHFPISQLNNLRITIIIKSKQTDVRSDEGNSLCININDMAVSCESLRNTNHLKTLIATQVFKRIMRRQIIYPPFKMYKKIFLYFSLLLKRFYGKIDLKYKVKVICFMKNIFKLLSIEQYMLISSRTINSICYRSINIRYSSY